MLTFVRAGRAALTFLTRLPVGGFPYGEAEWQWSSAWFPVVGALLGAIYAGVWTGVEPLLGASVAAVLVLVAGLLVTGAFHEDGLADSADALGGAYTRERILEILKDSRIGAFGAAALIVALMLRAALLVRLGPAAPLALVACECASRLPPIWLMTALPYVTADASAKSRLVARARPAQGIAATVLTAIVLAIGVLADGWTLAHAGALVAAGVAVAIVAGWRFHARLGGVTGDFLGATQQAAVCAMLAAFAITSAGCRRDRDDLVPAATIREQVQPGIEEDLEVPVAIACPEAIGDDRRTRCDLRAAEVNTGLILTFDAEGAVVDMEYEQPVVVRTRMASVLTAPVQAQLGAGFRVDCGPARLSIRTADGVESCEATDGSRQVALRVELDPDLTITRWSVASP